MNDKTQKIEKTIEETGKPSLRHLLWLWRFIFSSTKVISSIYLGLFVLLSLLRPLLAFIWNEYVATLEQFTAGIPLAAIGLLVGYWAISFLSSLIESYMAVNGDGDMEQLDAVQQNRQQEQMHTRLYKKLGSISYEYFEIPKINDRIAQVFSFIGNPMSGVNREVMLKGYVVIAKMVSLLSIAFSLWLFDPWLCLVLLVAPIPVLWTLKVNEKLRFRFQLDNSENQRRIKYFQDLMLSPAVKEFKVLGLYDFFYDKWKAAADDYTVRENRMIRRRTLLNTVNTVVMNLVNIGGLVFVIMMMVMGRISVGEASAVILLVQTLVSDTTQLFTSLITFLGRSQEAQQFAELMAIPEQADAGVQSERFIAFCAKNLKYRYPLTERYVLQGVDLRIFKGEKIAFVGENGAGKTTMVKLITGLLQPSDGELLINGLPQEELNLSARLDMQSVVSQSPARYTTFTVTENVFLGDTLHPKNEKKIDRALAFAGLDALPKDAMLGKDVGGTDLSGGQWQKLAIARAMYRDRDFIILDEPTSNLDPLAETEVFQKYISLAQDKTVLFVTHRISVASLASRIVVFKDGCIVEDGTHVQLMERDGEYARLYREQSKWYNV